MQTTFRSGILQHQTDLNGAAIFLKKIGSSVNIVVSPDPTLLAFIDGTTDYVYSEFAGVPNAWNTAVEGAYLYWEMDRVTGLISYEATMVDPIIGGTQPASPVAMQLWFDSANKVWWCYNAGWKRKLVVFAAKVFGGLLTSMSDRFADGH